MNSISGTCPTGSEYCASVNYVLQVPAQMYCLGSVQDNQVSLGFSGINIRFSKVAANIQLRILQAGKNLN